MMNKCFIDANVLIYYKTEEDQKHKESVFLIADLVKKETELCISSLVVDEFVHALIKIAEIKKKKKAIVVKKALTDILELPLLTIVETPNTKEELGKITEVMEVFGLKPRDAIHLMTMIKNKIFYLASFDQNFEKAYKTGVIKRAEKLKKKR